jgi:DNA-directed RNA polymerase specialized sigma24 family protein
VEWESEFAAFCVEEHPRLVGALSLYCGDRAVAEELAQDALSRACRDWNKIRHLGSPGAWTHRVAINLANSYFRRAAAETRAKRRLQGADEVAEAMDCPEGTVKTLTRKSIASLRQSLPLLELKEVSDAY